MSGPVVGSTGVRAMLLGFARLGLDARRIQREAGFGDDELADPEGVLSAERLYAMWELADRLWGRPGLGLAAGSHVPFGSLEVLDFLLASGPTVGDGLARLSEYFAVATRTARYAIRADDDSIAYEMVWRIPPRGVMFQVRDYSLAAVASRVREVSGQRPRLAEVAGPPLARVAAYESALGARTRLRAERNALVFSRDAWRAPLPRQDANLHRTLRRHAQLLLERSAAASSESLCERVRCELLRSARVGLRPIGEVAHGLGIGVRTLQRQLRLEGSGFAALADEVRGTLAREYVRDRSLTLGEVAYLLGFSERSAFSRAFRRWTGRSPRAFRTGSNIEVRWPGST